MLYQTSLVAIIIMTISGIGLSVLGWIAYAKVGFIDFYAAKRQLVFALSIGVYEYKQSGNQAGQGGD